MKHILLCAILLCTLISARAQSVIEGSIIDHEQGEPLPFVTVYNLTRQEGTTTDLLGGFTLNATPGKDSIQVSSLGYEDQYLLATAELKIRLKATALHLNEVVVSVNREQEQRTEAPVAIASITAKNIADNKPTSIDQVLNQTPGVNMVDLGNEQHTMSIRRPIDYGASYLYLEDGVPIRTSGVFNHNALLEINMANTGRIEIIRGPASSMYGSEAIGGAVNFISKKPTLSPTAGVSLQANTIGYKRTDFYASTTVAKKLGIRLAGYYADQKNGILEHSDFNKLALSLSANYYLSKNTELVWSNTLIDYYADMSGSLDSTRFYSKSYGSGHTFTNRQVDAYRSKLALNHYWNSTSKTSVTGYFRTNSIRQNPSYRVKDDYKPWSKQGDRNRAHGELNNNSFNSFGLIAQHKKSFKWLKSSVIAGTSVDYSPNTYEAEYIQITKSDAGTYDDFTKQDSLLADYTANLFNWAAYTQVKFQPIERLNIVGALRLDHFNYAFDNHLGSNAFTSVLDGENSFTRFTPKLGLTYDLKKNRGIYANYGQGFVPPQVTELYRGQSIPTLKPVYYDNYEMGGWMTLGKEKARLDVSVYRMDGVNEIISVLLPDGSRIRQNAGKTMHQGIEYGLTLQPHKTVQVRFSGTNAHHQFIDFDESGTDFSGKKMPQAPEWLMNAQVTYKPNYLKGLRFSVEWQHVGPYFMDQQNTKKYDGYDVFNVRAGYEWKAFEVWVNAMNVTDELFATVARATAWGQSYALGKPQHFNFGVAYRFKAKK